MTAEEHNKTLATLYLIYGAMHGLTLVALALLILVVGLASPSLVSISAIWITIGVFVYGVVLVAVGLLPSIVGYGLLKRRRWAKPVGIASAVINVINIPIGSALGICVFKFFRSEGGIKLYGGKASSATESELQEALRGARPLMNWADRLK